MMDLKVKTTIGPVEGIQEEKDTGLERKHHGRIESYFYPSLRPPVH